MSGQLRIDQDPVRTGRGLVRPRGDLDVHSSPRLREALVEAIDAGATALVVDLRAVTFVDSAGFSALMSGVKRLAPREGRLIAVTTNEQVLHAIKLMGLADLIPVAATPEEAWAALDGG